MNNTTDSFEDIAGDAVELLISIATDLKNSKDEGDKRAAFAIAAVTADFCKRALRIHTAG
jgi:hypothetical protein